MTGQVLAVRENQARLELGVEFPPEQRDAWQGASGSPVWVQGRICGVVAACEENFHGNRLEATAVCRLLELPEFRAAIGYDDRANLPAGTRSVAEIIMAGVDRRRAEFRTPVGEQEFPDGELCLAVPPECGRDPTCAEFQKAWNDHLIKKFVAQEDRERSRQDNRTLVGLAADELAHLAQEYRRTHYFIFDLPH